MKQCILKKKYSYSTFCQGWQLVKTALSAIITWAVVIEGWFVKVQCMEGANDYQGRK